LPDFATAVWTAPCTAPWALKFATGDPHLREVRTPIACQLSGEKSNKITANPLLTWHRLPTVILAETWALKESDSNTLKSNKKSVAQFLKIRYGSVHDSFKSNPLLRPSSLFDAFTGLFFNDLVCRNT
jgi:hypothetical protein